MKKKCSKCSEDKSLKDFSKYKTGTYRVGKPHSHCKECEKKKTREWVEKNKERYNKYQIEYYHKRKKMI